MQAGSHFVNWELADSVNQFSKENAASRWDWFSVLAIEVFQTRHVADGGLTALRARISQVPEEGFQLSHTFVGRIHWFSGNSQEQFVHNIIGISGGGSVISKQWNYCAQRLNLFADPLDILLFLAQNFIGIFHGLLLRNARAQAETILRFLLTRSVRIIELSG
jgi:hypothetical protein